MKPYFSNMKACKECNASGRVLGGYGGWAGMEPYYIRCSECDGQGHIVRGWKKGSSK